MTLRLIVTAQTEITLTLTGRELEMILVELHEDMDYLSDLPDEQDDCYRLILRLDGELERHWPSVK